MARRATYGFRLNSGGSAVAAPQTIASVGLDNLTFTPDGISAQDVGNVVVTMSPTSPPASGSITIGGADAALYQLTNSGNLPCKVQAKSTTGVGTDNITLTHTHVGIGNSPFTSGTITITGSALPALTAELTFAGGTPVGGTLIYDIATGTDMGDYVAPTAGFTQKCIRSRHASLANFFIDFRPDTTGGRVEVVVWNGEVFGTVASATLRNLTGYTLVIKDAGTPINTTVIAAHNWGTRWRYQSDGGRALCRSAADVFTDGFLPPMSSAAARISGYSGVIVPPAATIPTDLNSNGTQGDGSAMSMGATPYTASGCIYTPMMLKAGGSERLLGILCPGDTGGDRPELGLITEWQADWLLRGTSTSLNTMMQQANFFSGQAGGIYLTSQATGAPINQKLNITEYKFVMAFGNDDPAGTGYYRIMHGDGQYGCGGDEHSPQILYVPWVLTEDPYFIEGIQFWTNWGTGVMSGKKASAWGNLDSDPTGLTGWNGAFTVFSYPGEERDVGWGAKNVANAWVVSPASPPSWLVPQSTYAAMSSDYTKVINKYKTDGAGNQFYDVFHSVGQTPLSTGGSDTPQSFYKGYLCSSFGFCTYLGVPTPTAAGQSAPPTWFDTLTYAFDFLRQVADPAMASGWNCQNPLLHDLGNPILISNFEGAPSGCTVGSAGVPPSGNNCVTTYAQYWTYSSAYLNNGAPYPANPSPGFIGGGSISPNTQLVFNAAAIAKSCGITGAAAVMTWMGSLIDYSYPQASFSASFACNNGFDGT